MKLPTFWQTPSMSKMKGSIGWKNPKITKTPLETKAEATPKTGIIGEVTLKTRGEVVPRMVDPNNREVEVMKKNQYRSGTKVNPLKDHLLPKENPTSKTNLKDPPHKTDTRTKYFPHPM